MLLIRPLFFKGLIFYSRFRRISELHVYFHYCMMPGWPADAAEAEIAG